MSVEDVSKKTIADLGLSLNFHYHSIRLNNNIGAGVNATTSKLDITLVTSHPLSELVWCPSKGISVKNTDHDYSLTEKGSAILWGLRPGHMAVSSAKSINTKSNNSLEIFMDDKNDVSSPSPTKYGINNVDASGWVSRLMPMGGLIHGQDEVIKTSGSSPSIGVGNSDGLGAMPGNANISIRNQEDPGGQYYASATFIDQEGKILLKTPSAITKTSDELEFSAENYILTEASEDANPEALQRKGVRLVDRSSHAETNLTSQRKEVYLRKGKGKALLDGGTNDELAHDNVSQESAGSCNSKLASSRNTKRSLDQQLMVASKRFKQSTKRDADSASFIRQSSSFTSWITNMVKGYPGCNQDDAPSSMLAGMLTAHAEQDSRSQKPVGRELRDVGFRNLFRSICCSNNSVEGRKIYLDYNNNGECVDVKISSMFDVSAIPLAAYSTSDNLPQDIGQSRKMCEHPTSGYHVGSPSKQGMILSSKFSTKETTILPGMNTMVNKMEMDAAKSCQSILSADKEKAYISEYDEEKEAQCIGQKKDYLGNLWISRFRPKISQPASDIITSKFTKKVLLSSEKIASPGKGLIGDAQRNHSPGDPVASHGELRNGIVKHKGMVRSEQVNVKDEQNLEVMASVFAKRLDALKQVVPFDATCKSASLITTCIFCGVRGHDIQACSKISESELAELFHVIKSYDKFRHSPCLCIKCLQFSHWAIKCPQQTSRKSSLGSFVDWSNDRIDKEQKCLQEKSDHSAVGTLTPQGRSGNLKPDAESIQLQDSRRLKLEIAEARNPVGHVSSCWVAGESSSRLQNKISTAMEGIFDAVRRLRLSRSDIPVGHVSSCWVAGESSSRLQNKISTAMEGIFDAVRRLRLSRSDILRLVDSQISPSHLKGFYLRVRLSNWRECSGEKSYHVACIHGALDQAGRKTSVGVAIGSFICLVESRYISNQDFLEDELMTWWTETAKCDDHNPLLEELK